MFELLLANIIGLVLGIAASFIAWWIVFHQIVPKIEFSDGISSTPRRSDPSRRSYRVKFANTGRRAIIGMEVFARLSIKWEEGKNWSGYYIPLNSAGDRKYELPRLDRSKNRILTLWLNRSDVFRTNVRFPEALRKKAEEKQLTLEDLLSQGDVARLQLFVSGYDEFSGARKVFASPRFELEDIKNGRFKGLVINPEQTDSAEKAESTDLEAPVEPEV